MLFDKEELSILVVSASEKITDILNDLLKDRFHCEIKHAQSAGEAKQMIMSRFLTRLWNMAF